MRSFIILAVVLLTHQAAAVYVAPDWKVPGIAAKDTPQIILFTVSEKIDHISVQFIKHHLPTESHSHPFPHSNFRSIAA